VDKSMIDNAKVRLIISGGQSGADLAGNEFAAEMGIPTRCYVFEHFKPVNEADLKVMQKFECIPIKVTRPEDYVNCLRERTIFNVKRADATVIFINRRLEETRGSKLTWKMCEHTKKPYAIAYLGDWMTAVDQITGMLMAHTPVILNIAGERNLDRKVVRSLLKDAWKRLNGK
jgi:hypothetical protein